MRILYVAMKYDYGDPQRGDSFEHCNFAGSLMGMGHDLIYFDFMSLLKQHGRDAMNRQLLEVAKSEKPDVMFTVLFGDELDRATIRRISDSGITTTVNWFCDDHWRFEDFSSRWAPCFDWVVTTAHSALPKYEQIGYHTVIKSQWACNHFSYHKLNLPLKYDTTFVGQPYGDRRAKIDAVRSAGHAVHTWGHGWPAGRLSQAQMIEVFNQSRINFNPADSSIVDRDGLDRLTRLGKRLLPKRAHNWRPVRIAQRAAQAIVGGARSSLVVPAQIDGDVHPKQIKGRTFEVPGCGGFLLTEFAENLDAYYVDGKEVVCFNGVDDLICKVDYYLRNEDERAAIAEAGYRRTLREHTYTARFHDIFRCMGLEEQWRRSDSADQSSSPGHVLEVY